MKAVFVLLLVATAILAENCRLRRLSSLLYSPVCPYPHHRRPWHYCSGQNPDRFYWGQGPPANAQNEPSTKCGPNSVYSECISACEPSCNKPKPDMCTDECIRGCRCVEGFLLNSNRECVLTKNC